MISPPRLPKLNSDAVVGHFSAVAEAVDIPIVVQDYPPVSGFIMEPLLLARIARVVPAIAIVSDGADPATAARIGFHGFVSRAVDPMALARTIRAVSQGEIAFPRSALTGLFQLLSFLPMGNSDGDGPVALTPRQRQIVDLIAQGATDREIATRLHISESTAHKHVQNALRRSKTRTRSQLVAVARQGATS